VENLDHIQRPFDCPQVGYMYNNSFIMFFPVFGIFQVGIEKFRIDKIVNRSILPLETHSFFSVSAANARDTAVTASLFSMA